MIKAFTSFMNTNDQIVGPINIGNPVEFTMLDLAKMIIDITGSSSKLIFQKLPKDDPKQRRPDITQAKKKLGWEPKISLEKGLIETIKYFDAIL